MESTGSELIVSSTKFLQASAVADNRPVIVGIVLNTICVILAYFFYHPVSALCLGMDE